MINRILAIGDPHEPVSHPAYLPFCKYLYKKYRCNRVVIMGDIADMQAISFHAVNPDCPGAFDDYVQTKVAIKKWYDAFPNAKVCIGNHDERALRLAASVGVPGIFLRDYNQVWDTPGWDWQYEHIIDNVYYFHGTGQGGIHPAWNAAGKMLMSVVMGHCHSRSGIKWRANPKQRIFCMDTGCGIDVRAYQFAYGKHMKERPILSAGVVIKGIPYHEIMPCGPKEKWHHSKFEVK